MRRFRIKCRSPQPRCARARSHPDPRPDVSARSRRVSGGASISSGDRQRGVIDATHWLARWHASVGTIGIRTRRCSMIHAAAERLDTPVTLIALTWRGTASRTIHRRSPFGVERCRRSVRGTSTCGERHTVSASAVVAPPMYYELWTAPRPCTSWSPRVALGGEVVIFAPIWTPSAECMASTSTTSLSHPAVFSVRLGSIQARSTRVLAHKHAPPRFGRHDRRRRKANVRVTLASKISPRTRTT